MDEAPITETPTEPRKQDLYTRHLESFVKIAAQDFAKALDQFGFTVWHSLPPKDAAVLKERLGIKPLEAADYYNRGTVAGMEGDFQKAVGDLRAALKADPDFALAAHNLALCLEKLDQLDDAIKAWCNYLRMLDRVRNPAKLGLGTDAEIAQEAARVQQHLESLGIPQQALKGVLFDRRCWICKKTFTEEQEDKMFSHLREHLKEISVLR